MILNDKPNCQVPRILMNPRPIFSNRSENDQFMISYYFLLFFIIFYYLILQSLVLTQLFSILLFSLIFIYYLCSHKGAGHFDDNHNLLFPVQSLTADVQAFTFTFNLCYFIK
jgi:hypothetical protein